jgi:hypothetical protein
MLAVFGFFFLAMPFLSMTAIVVAVIVGLWKVFMKAGQPGWGCIIPIFNLYCLTKIAGKPGWWLLLYFIPFVNVVILLLTSLGVSRNFGKSDAFAVGLFFLPFIFYPILGFGDASYGLKAPPIAG